MELGVHTPALLRSQSLVGVSDQRACRLGVGTAGQGSRAVGGSELGQGQGSWPRCPRRSWESVWGDAVQKSAAHGGRGAAGSQAEGPGRPGSRRCAWDGGGRPLGKPPRPLGHLGHPAQGAGTAVPTSRRSRSPPAAVAEFLSSPTAFARTLRRLRPPSRGPQPHLGAGAGPAHRPEQQQCQAERPGGAGHGGALRTGPPLPPAEPRAATNPWRAPNGGRGGGAGAGPPRPREGPGRVPSLPPRPPAPRSPAAQFSPSGREVLGPASPSPPTHPDLLPGAPG